MTALVRTSADQVWANVRAALDRTAEKAFDRFEDYRCANTGDRTSTRYEALRDLMFASKDRADVFARETGNAPETSSAKNQVTGDVNTNHQQKDD